ncbi:hypothetical protein ISF_02257 [Cordyceps fumosorosea ARSEF 2679]|uniref:Small secreted protein n=1 Tax=Cordyceps fumosorosea (strain ARSEF 2679) TaxID=1081104 RepID=A0A168BLR8_CORFA|nr:hypothetical protein ISF_02257 [Cordyceps fumosorosea ARSEF 2679]OAA70283.1 hypothetical protein ISF_02257 [Cordyceps fumosorosea ARSEF 2679]
MQFSKILFALAATASAAPLAAREPDWIIQGLSRTCDAQDTSCTWNFSINDQQSEPTGCVYEVHAAGGQPASRSNGGPVTCGPYTVTSGWSGQFGEGAGFTTFAVHDYARNEIGYPAFTDSEVAAGNVPDKAFHVEKTN